MGLKLWMVKQYYKNWNKAIGYEKFWHNKKTELRIKFQARLNELSLTDYYKFGIDTGYISKTKNKR